MRTFSQDKFCPKRTGARQIALSYQQRCHLSTLCDLSRFRSLRQLWPRKCTFPFLNVTYHFFYFKLPLLVLSQAPDLLWLGVAWVLNFVGPLLRFVAAIHFAFQARESRTTDRCPQAQKVFNASVSYRISIATKFTGHDNQFVDSLS